MEIKFNLYNSDTKENLDKSICESIKTSIFDNKEIDEELVRYFASLGINLFDLNEPFFTDICSLY